MDIQQYIENLPLVQTSSLAVGTLFWANQRLYEVMEVDMEGYSRARQWRRDETTDVALIPKSTLSHRLPVVDKGRLLRQFKSRDELLYNQQALSYVFPDEHLALECASLDLSLCGRSSGLYTRRNPTFPAFEVTNGLLVLRAYFFMRTKEGFNTNLSNLKARLKETLIPHSRGPIYWHLLSSWNEAPYILEQTIAMRPINLQNLDVATQTHIQKPTDETTTPPNAE